MKKFCIEPYGIEIKRLGNPSGLPELLGAFGGKHNAQSAFVAMLKDIGNHKKLDGLAKTISVEFSEKNSNIIFGVMNVGEYGYESSIIDADSGITAYKKKKTDADSVPYSFYLALPPSSRQGFLMLPRYGGDGIRTVVGGLIAGMFSSDFPEYRLHIKPIVAAEYIRDVFNRGQIEEIAIEKNEIPSDIADIFGGKCGVPGKVKIIVNPSDKKLFKKDGIVSILTNSSDIASVFNIQNQDQTEIKVKLQVDGGERTIRLNNPGRLHAYYDITDTVPIGFDGYPERVALIREMETLTRDLAARVGIQI